MWWPPRNEARLERPFTEEHFPAIYTDGNRDPPHLLFLGNRLRTLKFIATFSTSYCPILPEKRFRRSFVVIMAGKSAQFQSFSSVCSLQRSLLTLAALTLASFTYFSLKSLHFPLQYGSNLSAYPPKVATEEFSDVYHSPEVFRLNYAEMEKSFKVFIYPDGDPNTYYQTPRKLTGKYASEGYFFQNIRESPFRTEDPDQAHLFFIPISCHKMRGKHWRSYSYKLIEWERDEQLMLIYQVMVVCKGRMKDPKDDWYTRAQEVNEKPIVHRPPIISQHQVDDEDALKGASEITKVVQQILTASKEAVMKDGFRTNIFHTTIGCGNHVVKLCIDWDSNTIFVSDELVDKLKLKMHKHTQPYKGTSYENMTIIVQNYVDSLISKYPYWNRTLGADHFFVTCHDVGVRATEGVPFLVKNSIRVVCSPSYDVGFIPHKDVALPQVLQPFALPAGGNDVENRPWWLFTDVSASHYSSLEYQLDSFVIIKTFPSEQREAIKYFPPFSLPLCSSLPGTPILVRGMRL
ncbi:hypothetical protein HHK36_009620 [Tetracentron sinense]|uniref:Exostosin GT47 domain-containing protein n=1 Tax=Tetracentron sinense TaxID=13715 RepID=A0A835DIJ1_TETSI|nr:hypothetical protein HHK36_009620 [Tetracentron sinense]